MDRIEIINQWNLSKVFQELENGNMRIPRFQRAYVWERSKIVKLLNSINCQYPIGSFFLWETDTQMESFCRDITEFGFPKKPQSNQFLFILDGQQRITSLYVTLKGKTLNGVDYSKICYNLDKKEFKLPQLKTEPNNIPVWQIYDNAEYSKLLKSYAKEDDDLAQALMDCKMTLDNYPVSIIKSLQMSLDEVVDIFERINQGGKRLSLFDLVHASVWSEDFDLREEIAQFNDETPIRAFGTLGEEVFTQSLALNIKGDCTKLVQLKLTNEECKAVWNKTKESLRIAIDYVKTTFGAQNLAILPYPALLPVIQYYIYKDGHKCIQPQHTQMISDWFWTVTFSTRYSSSTLTRMKEDADWILRILNGENEPRIFAIALNVEHLKRIRMNNASVIKNGILCLMAQNQPHDFDNGTVVSIDNTNASRANSKENHHFFPFSLHDEFGLTVSDINNVLNFAFITRRLNESISNDKPSIYLSRYEQSNPSIVHHMESHFINATAFSAAKQNDFTTFIEERGKTILTKINAVCQIGKGEVMLQLSETEEQEENE